MIKNCCHLTMTELSGFGKKERGKKTTKQKNRKAHVNKSLQENIRELKQSMTKMPTRTS